MLPLATAALLDTIKILLIGNGLTFANQMPSTFQNLMQANGKATHIDSVFMEGMEPECLLIKMLHREMEQCTEEFSLDHKVWKKGHPEFAEFSHSIRRHQIIYLQPQGLDQPILYELISSIIRVMDKNAIIVVFQPYVSQHWNKDARRNELQRQYEYFKIHNKSKKAILLPVGDYFDAHQEMAPDIILIDEANRPTKAGSDLIAETFNELALTYFR